MNNENKNLLLPAIVLILIIASYFVCTNWLIPSIFENSAKIEALGKDIASANDKLDSLSKADKSMTQLSAVVNSLLIAVPDNINSPDLITEVEVIASQNQVALPSLSPPTSLKSGAPSVSAGGLSTSLTVTGSFQNINNFINALETSIRFSKINSITLSSSDTGLTASISFEVYNRPAEAPALAPTSTEPETTPTTSTGVSL